MNKSSRKPRPSSKRPTPAAVSKGRQSTEIAALREKLKLVERERDTYARELARRVAKELGPVEIDEDECNDIIKNGSGTSLEALACEIAKDAKPREARGSKSPKAGSRRTELSNGHARKFAEVQSERDAFAKAILDRLMPEMGPINFNKRELLQEASRQPDLNELIDSLAAETES